VKGNAHLDTTRVARYAPSPFLGGGEKVAAGRMRGGAANADRSPLTPALSAPLRKREGEATRRVYSLGIRRGRFTHP